MNCAFCGQWNPASAQQCCFCRNAPGAAVDATVSCTVTAPARPIKVLAVPHDAPRDAAAHRTLPIPGRVIAALIGLAGALLLIIARRC